MRHVRTLTRTLVMTAAVIAFGMPLAAQDGSNGARYVDRADELSARAEALYDSPDQWKRVARLHEEAADLRSLDDPRLLGDLLVASSLAAHFKAHAHGARLMERVADAALANGKVKLAADSYINAAILRQKSHAPERARALVERARLLANSPHLSAFDCDCIRNRIKSRIVVASH